MDCWVHLVTRPIQIRSLTDERNRFKDASGTDYAFLRRRMAPRLVSDARPPEYVRVNLDIGKGVSVLAVAWAMVTDGMHPTITLHGSNNASFFLDLNVNITLANLSGSLSLPSTEAKIERTRQRTIGCCTGPRRGTHII
jgi:hypothetical protein